MKGITLIEILLVIAIILTVGFFSAAFSTRLIPQLALKDAQDEFKSVLLKAEANAISGKSHSAWGVHYANSVLTLFQGDDYANRDSSFDEQTVVNEKISISDWRDAIFAYPGGRPQTTISNIILSWGNVEETNLSLNAEGVVE